MLNLKNTLDGYLKNVEVIGNTIQDINNLADIRSVGDKVLGQELYKIDVVSCGKNFFDGRLELGGIGSTGNPSAKNSVRSNFIRIYTDYTVKRYDSNVGVALYHYDIDYNYLGYTSWGSGNRKRTDLATYPNTKYIRLEFYNTSDINIKVSMYEETTDLPYEPYQENKLEILSPVQLEKVGDVADRIIYKDGVWGVEKRISAITFDGSENWGKNNVGECYLKPLDVIPKSPIICDKLENNVNNASYIKVHNSNNEIAVKNSASQEDISTFKTYLSENNLNVKYQTTNPQFIPLPHDQQVKLRTFAGQTNIAFLTEIPGQIKAQVPKSLGATVNTHTEQIADLHNSLDRVKKLEETTVSTVETESNFTTVDATSNGYFEDVKLEGKTLVNKLINPSNVTLSSGKIGFYWNTGYIFTNKNCYDIRGISNNFTIISTTGKPVEIAWLSDDGTNVHYMSARKNIVCNYIELPSNATSIAFYVLEQDGWTLENALNANIMLLEGDHTNNPPGYYKGLMSVGQDVEEVIVGSVNENLISKTDLILNTSLDTNGNQISHVGRVCTDFIRVPSNCNLYFRGTNNSLVPNRSYVCFYDKGKNVISSRIQFDNFKILTPHNCRYVRFITHDDSLTNLNDVVYELYIGSLPNQYTHHQSNKKPLLYYNPTTETWEKPILRAWDTIEKHSDGKYYYHKRSGEVVLNGSESCSLITTTNQNDTIAFQATLKTSSVSMIANKNNFICDRFTFKDVYLNDINVEGINVHLNYVRLSILKSKLATQDVTGFKAWLKANPTTVVYQLAQEEVYECTNIDLMAYSGETNYIINSGAISPKSLLKVHNNISNVVKILQEKVSLLENTFIAGLKSVLSGDMYSLATILYPEDFEQNDNTEQDIMVIPE